VTVVFRASLSLTWCRWH